MEILRDLILSATASVIAAYITTKLMLRPKKEKKKPTELEDWYRDMEASFHKDNYARLQEKFWKDKGL